MRKKIIYMFGVLALSWSCTGHGEHSHDDAAQSETGDHSNEIVFTSEQAKNIGLEVISIEPTSFHEVIKTSGQILSPPGDEVTVSATASGIVSFNKSSINEGVSVGRGESLLSISSRNLPDGDPGVKARSTYEMAEKEFQRAQSLIGDKLISEKEFNEAKLYYENAKVSYQSYAKGQTNVGAGISAPISGYIKARLVNEGQYVEVGQPLFTITQSQKLQLRADISERYYKDLKNITSANFRIPYYDGVYQLSELGGKLVSYGKSTSSDGFYIPVSFEFNNVGNIVPGSYVEVYLLGKPRADVLTVPVSSLIESQGLYFVYIQLNADDYKKQEVKLGASDGQNVEILSGLKTGDKVVSKGAYHIKLAAASGTLPQGHTH
ncbi:efflux RND transporter periplasmic adaptor subunit [Dysgonomonas sp. HDW5A]|uniref:efflux RND transporter periplasmic adaptor subunit n=1 Tax=Dysgonomonas sp. HDW5A TaxID=2714926 RepID=UPI001408CFB3|nr:efflux RND transporter periplasmic adaptor subunit [Dysgonomonas sp. HDW5A]QIK58435.1 efflux RND transporter periplasmic adaptor subunit [Dysgonomonas sp. HDW5A]